ncbi:MAG: hypothetical protein NWR72_13385 [Bacteroidia bacterium]|nr:hypothetical protein [Bacteroidia bacterium]
MNFNPIANKPLPVRILITIAVITAGIVIGVSIGKVIGKGTPQPQKEIPPFIMETIDIDGAAFNPHPFSQTQTECQHCIVLQEEVLSIDGKKAHFEVYPNQINQEDLRRLHQQSFRIHEQLDLHKKSHSIENLHHTKRCGH